MFLLCSTASDTDPSVTKSFTLACVQTLFRFGPLSSFPSYCMPSSPPSALHSHVCRAITGCDAQVRSWPPTSCRAEVDSGHIFLRLVHGLCFLSFRPVLWNISNNVTTQSLPHKQKAFMCLVNLQQTGVQLDQREHLQQISVICQCHHVIFPCTPSDKAHCSSSLVLTYRGTLMLEYSLIVK